MRAARQAAPGTARVCPHCRATILESEVVCPGCHHHLRAGKVTAGRQRETFTPLRVHGIVRNPELAEACEFSVLVTVRDAGGVEVNRQVVAVGALHGNDVRSFALDVQVYVPRR